MPPNASPPNIYHPLYKRFNMDRYKSKNLRSSLDYVPKLARTYVTASSNSSKIATLLILKNCKHRKPTSP